MANLTYQLFNYFTKAKILNYLCLAPFTKSVGEAALNPAAAAICNAIYNAVGARIIRLPVTAESLLKAIKTKETDRLTVKRED